MIILYLPPLTIVAFEIGYNQCQDILMSGVNPEFVERYQLEFERNPRSKVFAPLAEAYRKMGLLDAAEEVCQRGVQAHPDFASGRVAYGKVLYEQKRYRDALEQLQHAIELAHENVLAHLLIGEIQLVLRRPKEALKAFKMVLLLNPLDARAAESVRKWEFLTADEYEVDSFQVSSGPMADRPHELERAVSIVDALTIRGESAKAKEVVTQAIRDLGEHPALTQRLKLLKKKDGEVQTHARTAGSAKQELLERLLRRISQRRS